MAGHSKWKQIKHKKAATDAKRSKVWTKVIKELTVAARIGGGDVNANPRLRLALDKAKAAHVRVSRSGCSIACRRVCCTSRRSRFSLANTPSAASRTV